MEVNVNRLIGAKMSLEEYFVLISLYNEDEDVLRSYMNNVGTIGTATISGLISKGYLVLKPEIAINPFLKPEAIYLIENVELTDKFATRILSIDVTKGISFNDAFNQLREHYPSKVTDPTGKVRRLHSDPIRCKRLYKTEIARNGIVDEEKHALILQCLDYEVAEKKRGKNLEYMKLLSTWISKKEWELVQDEVEQLIKKNGSVAVNTNDEGGFQEEV